MREVILMASNMRDKELMDQIYGKNVCNPNFSDNSNSTENFTKRFSTFRLH